jgi:hypothetical protein
MAKKRTLGALLVAAANVGNAAAHGAARKQIQGRGPRKEPETTCTPCAAMAKRQAASAWVSQK